MPYLVDGHNLIPNIPGLSLSALEDELELIPWLQEFCRQRRKQVEVYFDRGQHGVPPRKGFGLVSAVFVPAGMTADNAIRLRLRQLGKGARNWIVVSSDRQVQAEARSARAQVISSADFAAQLIETARTAAPRSHNASPPSLNEREVNEWMEIFRRGKPRDKSE